MSTTTEEPPHDTKDCSSCGDTVSAISRAEAQRKWAARTVRERTTVLRKSRHLIAERTKEFVEAISPLLPRSKADTLVSEVLPLLDACLFLEKNAARILSTRKLGRKGRPFWLGGVQAEVHREPYGHVLVIGPANFPLFLAGTQVLQALAAGNSVTWKPGHGGAAVADVMATVLAESGLPAGLLQVTGESVEAARVAIADGPDKVIFTGAAASGAAVLTELANTATPAVAELSGVDAMIVFPSADLDAVAEAVAFGLRLNGGQVCMSPRRLFATKQTMSDLRPRLTQKLEEIAPVAMDAWTSASLTKLLRAAAEQGAVVKGSVDPIAQRPVMVEFATSEMAITQSDVMAPVISLIVTPTLLQLHEAYDRCEYALTTSIFCGKGDLSKARGLAKTLRAGTVLINDLIVPTADPRVPFGGRGASGYGVTRGAEGLLEMTAVKTLLVRRGGLPKYFDRTTDADVPLFSGLIRAAHGRNWRERLSGLRMLVASSRSRSEH